jgi:hypothetical protein
MTKAVGTFTKVIGAASLLWARYCIARSASRPCGAASETAQFEIYNAFRSTTVQAQSEG